MSIQKRVVNVQGSIIHNSQKVETTQMPATQWTDKHNGGCPKQWAILSPSQGRRVVHTATRTEREDILSRERSQEQNGLGAGAMLRN